MTRSPVSLGYYIDQRLRERNETWSDLSCTTGLSEAALEQLVSGKRILTGDVAVSLADHFGLVLVDLLNVQRHYHLSIREEETSKMLAAA